MKNTSAKGSLAALVLGFVAAAPAPVTAAQNLNFSKTSTPTDANGAFGPYHKFSPILRYTDVVTDNGNVIDALVTATTWGVTSLGTGSNSGLYSNYSQNAAEPNYDAGIYFTSDTKGLGGVHYDIEFFLSGTTTPYILDEFSLMLYDIDGDNKDGVVWQQEQAKAYIADGFTSYRLLTGDSQLQPTGIEGGMNFKGTSVNWPELNANGAVILNYENTSRLRLDFYANTFGGTPNGSFIGIDGDVSFAAGDFVNYTPPIPVPEAGTAGLLAGAALLGLTARRRRA
ncbi:MAG: hypothetical protein V4726_06475 [Verrucomicrobiota bacterium]